MTEKFFSESKEQSKVKTAIVTKYFDVWYKVIIPSARRYGSNKIGYVDLFAGPGRYDDGTKSTPIRILEKAIADPNLRSMLVSGFNDADAGINAGSKVKRKADEKCNTLIHFPICSETGTGGRKGCTQTWRCGETFAGESS